jgi:hypothetical protein
MEPWREHLTASLVRLNRDISNQRQTLFGKLEGMMTKHECTHCQLKCFDADMLTLCCGHSHCFDCITDQLECLIGFFERNYRDDAVKHQQVLRQLVVCSHCRKVTVTKKKVVFTGRMETKQHSCQGREMYEVDNHASEEFGKNWKVEKYFMNERRSPLGRFCTDSLSRKLERPPISDEKGNPLDLEKMNQTASESGFIWLEEWSFDKTLGNPQGWQYANVSWPKDEHGYRLEPSLTTLIRRRLMQRACVKRVVLEELTKNGN